MTPPKHSRGFTAVIAVMLISGGIMALSLSTLAAAVSYSDYVYQREHRIQRSLDDIACSDSAKLIKAKDAFASGTVHLGEFDCDMTL